MMTRAPIRRVLRVLLGLAGVGPCACDSSGSDTPETATRHQPLDWTDLRAAGASDRRAGDEFGFAVSVWEDRVLVGAPGKDDRAGAAYIFERVDQSDRWSQAIKLTPDTPSPNAEFGYAVSLEGDLALVGAPGAYQGRGTAYAFVRDAVSGQWKLETLLNPDALPSAGRFAHSLSQARGHVFIGAPEHNQAQGAVYLWTRTTSGTWSQGARLIDTSGVSGDRFGFSLATWGEAALVGVPGRSERRGAGYLFERGPQSDTWTVTTTLETAAGQVGDALGTSVALHDKTVLISAPGEDEGTVYVLDHPATGKWVANGHLKGLDPVPNDFGRSLAVYDDLAFIGAWDDAETKGAVFLFEQDATSKTWQPTMLLGLMKNGNTARLGSSLAVHRNIVATGLPGNNNEEGAIGVWRRYGTVSDPCEREVDCLDFMCRDGFCCDTSCENPCDRCDLPQQEGTCNVVDKGNMGAPSCFPYACDGTSPQCGNRCDTLEDCASGAQACLDGLCLSSIPNGYPCGNDAACESAQCSDGVCCETDCDGSCGRCDSPGSLGKCLLLPQGDPGAPRCAPYVCDGDGLACPTTCKSRADCVEGSSCQDGTCARGAPLGSDCETPDECSTEFCTDNVCCAAANCGAYTCQRDGSCAEECSTSAHCASGFECTSAGRCVAQGTVGEGTSAGACRIGTTGPRQGPVAYHLIALVIAVGALRRGRRT